MSDTAEFNATRNGIKSGRIENCSQHLFILYHKLVEKFKALKHILSLKIVPIL
ncbi:hypothetical protein D3C87_1064220 [compost metagenome]